MIQGTGTVGCTQARARRGSHATTESLQHLNGILYFGLYLQYEQLLPQTRKATTPVNSVESLSHEIIVDHPVAIQKP
jgi:hypothetical protein